MSVESDTDLDILLDELLAWTRCVSRNTASGIRELIALQRTRAIALFLVSENQLGPGDLHPLETLAKELLPESLADDILQNSISVARASNALRRVDRHSLSQHQDGLCACCGSVLNESQLHLDHRVPLAMGGTNGLDNLQLLCESCNTGKGARLHWLVNKELLDSLFVDTSDSDSPASLRYKVISRAGFVCEQCQRTGRLRLSPRLEDERALLAPRMDALQALCEQCLAT